MRNRRSRVGASSFSLSRREREQGASVLTIFDTAEGRRLLAIGPGARWRQWGPYLSERQWGTVREDYSPGGTAWDSFPHDHARSRAYRWGEDGIAGFSDDQQHWCMALALWNGCDPILKERLFGLTNSEGNHGEDVKEQYFFTDGTPTHSYMRMLYRYPQAAFPYERLIEENRRRGLLGTEWEIADSGVMDAGHFDVTVEWAKAGPEDILWQVTARNHGPAAAPLHILPHFWARNQWSWDRSRPRSLLRAMPDGSVLAEHPGWRSRRFSVEGGHPLLFCENETNTNRLYGAHDAGPFKDGIGNFVVGGDAGAVASNGQGTKVAAHAVFTIPPGQAVQLRARLRPDVDPEAPGGFDAILQARRGEADEYHAALAAGIADPDRRRVHRQAVAGLLWTKQFYHLDVPLWLDGDPTPPPPPPPERKAGRNRDWRHLNCADVMSMPDTWEYPWFAAWDLAFHCVALAPVDPAFAKDQLLLLMREWYMHPNGQLPAYEWAFGDVNPPVQAWAALRVYQADAALAGHPDRGFLVRVFHKLMLNFAWWVNRKDPDGHNVFQGGFLGLDNIGVFDRSKPLPTGGTLDQADGTAWMAMYALNMLRIALILARDDIAYEDIASKFFEHFLTIAEAMTKLGMKPDPAPASPGGDGANAASAPGSDVESAPGDDGLWNEADGFYYDVLRLPDGRQQALRIRSMVGLIPLFAVEVLEPELVAALPGFAARLDWVLKHRPHLAALVSRWQEPGAGYSMLLSLLRGHRMKALLSRMLDETEFLSDHGIRSLSKVHAEHPYVLQEDGQTFCIAYEPGEGTTRSFGGNSNWRGPVWMPVNYLILDSLREFHRYYGPKFQVECPVGSGQMTDLAGVADELARRLTRLFLRGPGGRRPAMGDAQEGEGGEDAVLFHEYFHGETGRGLGAAHQTGWTALVTLLL